MKNHVTVKAADVLRAEGMVWRYNVGASGPLTRVQAIEVLTSAGEYGGYGLTHPKANDVLFTAQRLGQTEIEV